MRIKSIGLTTVFFLSFSALAEVHHAPMPAAAALPQQLRAGDQYFDLSVGGVENFLASIQTTDPKAYEKLAPDLEKLKQLRSFGTWMTVGAVAVGLAGYIGSISMASSGSIGGGTLVLAAVGTAVLLVSPFTYQLFGPGRTDYMNFVNKHNLLRPSSPIHMQLGFAPTLNGAKTFLALRF